MISLINVIVFIIFTRGFLKTISGSTNTFIHGPQRYSFFPIYSCCTVRSKFENILILALSAHLQREDLSQ